MKEIRVLVIAPLNERYSMFDKFSVKISKTVHILNRMFEIPDLEFLSSMMDRNNLLAIILEKGRFRAVVEKKFDKSKNLIVYNDIILSGPVAIFKYLEDEHEIGTMYGDITDDDIQYLNELMCDVCCVDPEKLNELRAIQEL